VTLVARVEAIFVAKICNTPCVAARRFRGYPTIGGQAVSALNRLLEDRKLTKS